MKRIVLTGDGLTLDDLVDVADRDARVSSLPPARRAMAASRRIVERAISRGDRVYGVTTGFGKFADVTIPADRIEELQRNLVRSHSAGVGQPLADRAVRAMIALRANALAKGFSGIRVETVQSLLDMLAADVLPVVPEQGSVGASGDLAPLAHLALGLIGEGRARRRGRSLPAGRASARGGLEARRARRRRRGSLSSTASRCRSRSAGLHWRALSISRAPPTWPGRPRSTPPADRTRRSTGASWRPAPTPEPRSRRRTCRHLLAGSAIRESHRGCGRIQDNYALRCMPQVHGAARDAFDHAREVLEREMNSATDNPLVFRRGGDIVSGGNFHGAPVGLVLDYAAIAATDLASISERRIEKLLNPALSDLPAFLVAEGGLHSGLMMAQVAAAALVSECKALAHPASVDSIPTSADKEDHVSMSPIAARKLAAIVENLERVLAIELLAAFQAMEFLRPLTSSPPLERVRRAFRRFVAPWKKDRILSDDLETARAFLDSSAMTSLAATLE